MLLHYNFYQETLFPVSWMLRVILEFNNNNNCNIFPKIGQNEKILTDKISKYLFEN